ncbi:MAG: ATP-binding domain-containing protein [Lachnospiraceae bacterium]|jgi:DNA helicase-2/ATP-dependent DNA helicase PcrA|nr:ATP-binding domain-containing protein [Lachnospiraceae bacterium]
MTEKEQIWQEEWNHFQYCIRIIAENIDKYEVEYESWHKQVQELYRSLSGGNIELYARLMTAINLQEQAATGLRKNKAALRKPFFGRIDYRDLELNKMECNYIGKNGVFLNKTDVLIVDWRAPISSVYYENELGQGTYALPEQTPIPIDLLKKRTYDVEEGTLVGYYDSDIAANDTLLVKYLSAHKDAVLGEIIATIQKEQNAIIRETPFANLIVQGVAGSGKTTVAMHRISYLLYNYKERFEPNEYCIVGSNDVLLRYITSGLPELDADHIRHLRMDQLFIRLCEKDWTSRYSVVETDASATVRCRLRFIKDLELEARLLRKQTVQLESLVDPFLGTILSESSNRALYQEHPTFSIAKQLSVLDERAKTRIQFLVGADEKEKLPAYRKTYRGHYKNMRPKGTIVDLYERFLLQWGEREDYDMQDHIKRVKKKQFDVYDIAALALLHYRINQMKANQEFSLLFLDEAQDFGVGIYYVLKTILPDAYFTMMGDVSQNINYETGMNDWHQLRQLFLTSAKDQFLLLEKSYRNTIEISQYAGQFLEKASGGRYKINPVIRHGKEVSEEILPDSVTMVKRAQDILLSCKAQEFLTMAIICMDDQEAEKVQSILLPNMTQESDGVDQSLRDTLQILPIRLVKGLEFDAVILWNPDLKSADANSGAAKLLYVAATRALHELYVLREHF